MALPELARVQEIAKGMWITFKSMFEKPVTYQYPEQKRPVHSRFRGRHVLNRYENGLEKCIGCSLCAAACPADAIFMETKTLADGGPAFIDHTKCADPFSNDNGCTLCIKYCPFSYSDYEKLKLKYEAML